MKALTEADLARLEQLPISREPFSGRGYEFEAVDLERLVAAARELNKLKVNAAKARKNHGWCVECDSNTHPNWCVHSKAEGLDPSAPKKREEKE